MKKYQKQKDKHAKKHLLRKQKNIERCLSQAHSPTAHSLKDGLK